MVEVSVRNLTPNAGNKTQIEKQGNIVGLHYLRAIATILVVVTHAISTASLPKYFGRGMLTDFFERGGGEVDLFFIMSGFIMVFTATNSITGSPRLSASEFLKRRAIRLGPMLWISVLFFDIAYYTAYHNIELWDSLRALFVWPVGTVVPGPAWTIRYEVAFYLMFSACFLWKPRLRPLCLIWFTAPILRYFISGVTEDAGTLTDFLFSPFNLEFGIGVSIALLLKGKSGVMPYRWQIITLIFSALLIRGVIKYLDLEIRTLPLVIWTLPLLFGTMFIAVLTRPTTESKVLKFIGDASYSIFLLHVIFVTPIILILSKAMPWMSCSLAAAFAVLLSVILSCLAHVFIEKRIASLLSFRTLKVGLYRKETF
jgi:exopolysaccharide production protein ExoZ